MSTFVTAMHFRVISYFNLKQDGFLCHSQNKIHQHQRRMSIITPFVSSIVFEEEGHLIIHQPKTNAIQLAQRRFRAFFGVTPKICEIIWANLRPKLPPFSKPKHLTWACLFLKVYSTEHVHKCLAKVDERTFRKWAWVFIELMANMNLVRS